MKVPQRPKVYVLLAVFSLLAASCGGEGATTTTDTATTADGGETTTTAGEAEGGLCADGGEPRDTSLVLPFPFAVPFFSVFVADSLGYFEEEGLNVEISFVDGSASVVQQVVANNVDFGMSDPGPILDAITAGEDLVVPYVFQTGLIYGLVVPEDSPHSEVADLAGETVAVSEATAGEVPFFEALLASNGIDPETGVTIVESGAGGSTAAAFEAGRIVSYFSDYFNIIELGFEIPLKEFDLGEFGLFHAASVVTQDATVESDPDLVVCLTRAMARASEFTHASPEAALIAIASKHPDQVTDPEGFDLLAIQETIKRTIPYEESGGLWGWNRPESWQGYVDFLAARGELEAELDPTTAYTNDLIEQTNDFDADAERQAAEELASSG